MSNQILWQKRLIEVRDKVIPEIKEIIKDDPTLFNMGHYIDISNSQKLGDPGTSACLAGWIANQRPEWSLSNSIYITFKANEIAIKISGTCRGGKNWKYLFGPENPNSINKAHNRISKFIKAGFKVPPPNLFAKIKNYIINITTGRVPKWS